MRLNHKIEKKQSLLFTMKPLSFEKMGDKLIRVSCYLLGIGINRNGSNITKEAIVKANEKLAHLPVVGHLIQDDEGSYYMGGHDIKIEDKGRDWSVEPLTVALGCIAGDKKFEFVTLKEFEGTDKEQEREYLKVDMIIWNHMSPVFEAAYSKDVYFNHSIEIDSVEGIWDATNNLRIDSFEYDRACLLGLSDDYKKHVEPCFPESKVYPTDYNLDSDFNKQFSLLMQEIKKFNEFNLEESESTILNINSIQQIEDNQNNPKKEEDVAMELNPIVVEKVNASLKEHTYKSNTGKTYEKYAFISITDKDVSFYNREDTYKSYTAPYIVTEPKENELVIAIDFEAKTENENKSEFSIQKEVDTMSSDRVSFALSEQESATIKDLLNKLELKDSEYSALMNENKIQKDQIDVFVREKEDSKMKVHKDTTDTIINSFATLIGKNADFDEYRARLDYSKSIEDVEQDCKLILANQTLANDKSRFAKFGYNGVEAGIVSNRNLAEDPMRARYGDAFDKF